MKRKSKEEKKKRKLEYMKAYRKRNDERVRAQKHIYDGVPRDVFILHSF